MKKIIQWLMLAALFWTAPAFAGGSNPGLYYGQIPTAAQWNSYFAAKLDYTPGAVNTIPYWDGSGSQLNALVSGDCTSAANVFTCTHATSANNIVGGTQWGVLYQSAVGATASTSAGASGEVLTSNGTSAPTFQTIGSPFAAAIHAAADKTTPIGADEVGIWDSVTGLLNRVSFTNMLSWFAAKNGSASQVFSVATATAAAHAVPKAQFDAGVAGSVIQTVSATYGTLVSTTSATAVDSGLTATITPKYATSKILVIFNTAISIPPTSTAGYYSVYLLRGATIIAQSAREGGPVDAVNAVYHHGNTDMSIEDSPATTAATTYKVQFASGIAGQTVEAQHSNFRLSSMTLMEIAQ